MVNTTAYIQVDCAFLVYVFVGVWEGESGLDREIVILRSYSKRSTGPVRRGLSVLTLLAVQAGRAQRTLAGVAPQQGDAGGARGTERRRAVLSVTHRHRV